MATIHWEHVDRDVFLALRETVFPHSKPLHNRRIATLIVAARQDLKPNGDEFFIEKVVMPKAPAGAKVDVTIFWTGKNNG